MSFLTPELTKETDLDLFSGFDLRETPFGEYMGAKLDEGFDYTTTRMAIDEGAISSGEVERYGRTYEQDRHEQEREAATGSLRAQPHLRGPSPFYLPHDGKPMTVLSEEEWKASKHYREGMKWREDMTDVRAEYMARAFDQRRYRDSLIDRSPAGLRSAGGFVAQLFGNLPDPVNFVPFARAVKGGAMASRIGAAAFEGAASTAAADAFVLPDLADRGEAVGWQDAAMDIFFGTFIGGTVGFGGHKLHQRRVSKLKHSLLARHRDVHARAAEKAVADLAAGEPVDVSPVYRSSEDGMAAFREAQEIARVYDDVKAKPTAGPADEVLAVIEPRDIERILIERGPAIERGDGSITVHGRALKRATGSKRGYGLVKIIWKHGEKSGDSPHVRKADVVDLPRIVREFEPEADGEYLRWRVAREDGEVLLVSAKSVEDGQRVVTMHIEKEPGGPLSAKKERSGSLRPPVKLDEGYRHGGYNPDPRGPNVNKTVGTPEEAVNWSAGRGDEFTPVELPETKDGELDALGLDKDGNSPEIDAIQEMYDRGELSLEEMAAIERVAADFESKQRLEDSGLKTVNCVLETIE